MYPKFYLTALFVFTCLSVNAQTKRQDTSKNKPPKIVKFKLANGKGSIMGDPPSDPSDPNTTDQGLYIYKNDAGKYGYKSSTSKIIIRAKYNNASNFYERLAIVSLKGKFGFINETGKIVVPIIYDSLENFNQGKAKAILSNEKFHIDKTGKRIN